MWVEIMTSTMMMMMMMMMMLMLMLRTRGVDMMVMTMVLMMVFVMVTLMKGSREWKNAGKCDRHSSLMFLGFVDHLYGENNN